MTTNYDVAIIGAGPTGLILGHLLANLGHDVVLIERHEQPYPLPRAISYDHEVARILDAVGISDAMAPNVEVPGLYQWRNAAGDLLFELSWNGNGLSGFPHSYVFSQPQLEGVLNDKAQGRQKMTLMRGMEASQCREDGQGVSIKLHPFATSGPEREIRAQYVVGADGANSAVRSWIGSDLIDLGFSAEWLVVDVLPAHADSHLPVEQDVMLQVCDPRRPTTVVSGGPGRRRWEFMALEGESLESLNNADTAWELLRPWKVTPENALLERHAIYRFRGALAERWRKSRLFIAGDAAHLTPPFAGQGLCAGARDAIALSWRLDAALQGRATDAMLNSYESERKVHAQAWIETAIALGKVICVLDPAAASERDRTLIEARKTAPIANQSPPPSRLGNGMRSQEVTSGILAAGGLIRKNGKVGRLDDLVGRGFALLSRGSDPVLALTPPMKAFWDEIGGVSAGFGPLGTVEDVSGVFLRWFDEIGAEVVLVRPDFYIFGTACDLGAAQDLVSSLRGFFAGVHGAGTHRPVPVTSDD